MASRHEIVTIDFRANAAKANPAMKSLQQAARDLREEIDKTRETANEAAKNGATEAELQKFEKEITSQLKTLKQYEAAINSLSKGVGTLARAIDAFNAGTLDKMNATFQKQSFNAAENAKKLLVPGSEGYEKNMAELDALQQKNLENLAKYKLRTEQLLQSIGEGGKISATDLKTEADGLEELMKLLPHLGNEWQEYYQILLRVRDAIKQQADEEKRLKGAIADANDARARSAQLTKQGAEEARQQHEAAKKVVEGETAIISKMKEEREEKRKNMADSAAILQQKDKEIESQRKTVAAWETAIKNEKKDTKAREDRIIALKQENETLQTTADTNRKAVEQMKGDMKGLEDQLKDVNAELEKMGTSASEEPAAVAPAATPAAPAAVKKEETQAVEEKTEADKKEEQAVKDKTKAKKDETQAVKESTEAKKEEAKVSEKLTEMEKEELKNQILARQDELKAQLQDLYNEKKEYARQQEQNTAAAKKEAEAVKEEANAYKDLTKEQAEALLQQKRATITKGEDGRFSFTNAEEAQHFIMESMRQMGGKNGNEYSLSDKGQVKQLLSQFKERYGLQSDDDTVGAIRGLFASGGLVESGVMNPFLPRMNVKASESAAAYAKDMKDLTAIVNGNTEAVKENVKVTEESNKAKRTEADIDADIKAKESESKQLTMKLREMNGQLNTTEQLIKKKSSLVETSRKSAEAFKEELAVLRTLNKEQAALMLKGMTEPSTVKFKGGTPFASDVEEVQSWFIKSIKGMVGNGHAFDEGGTLRLDEKGIASMVERFKERYKFDGGKKDLNDLFKSVVQSKGGLFESGFVSDFGKGGKLSINYDALAFEQRIKVMDTLTEVSGGAAKATDKVTKSTKDNTAAAKENTDTISEQERKVADLKQKWDDAKEEYRKYNDEYKRQMREVKRLEKGSIDEQLLAREKESAAETYKETYVDKAATRRDQYKQLYTSSNNKLNRMRKAEGQGIQEATAAENQNTEATERNTQAKGRKAKATKAAVDAQKEQNKADGESIAQNQQLSAEEQKKQELLRRRDTLQGQLNEKQEKANQLEEQAAGADTKRENNLKTITNLQNENINAHTKNEQGYKREKENLEKLESQQDKNIKKYNEDKEAVEGFTQKIDEHATKRAEANKRAAQTERLTIDAMNDAIKALETENRAIDPQSAKWQENTRVIQQYKAEIDRLKNQPVLQMMTERMGNIRNLSADALTETKRFWEQMTAGAEHGSHKLAVYEGNLKVIAEEERQRQQQIQAPMRENLNSLGRLSTADLTETKRYWQTVRDGADQTSAAYKKAELAVKALANEEQRRKDHAQAQYISDQMKDLNNLSVSGLAEVKRYWQAMADGARRSSDEAKDAANALARINEVELRNTKQQVRPLFGDLSKKGTEEIRAAIEAGRRLIDTYDSGSPAAQRLAQAIVDAEEHLKKYGVEAERAARREVAAVEEAAQRRKEQDNLMRQQLDQGAALSDSALKAQQQYWQRLIDDPKTAKESLAGYRYELERTIELQEQQANTTRDKYAARLGMPNQFANLSEAELRQSIEAGKQLLSTYKSGSAEAEQLAKNILAAENHIKTYGLEAQRAAQKEAQAVAEAEQKRRDADTTMRKQLYNTKDLTESALKAQEQYWKRLIDDPNTAAASLDRYRKDLEQVHLLQEQMEQQRGARTLERAQNGEFATASMDEIDKTIKKLKEYQALIKDPNGTGKEAFETTKEQVDALTEQLNRLKGVAEKVKGSFKDADEVLARFGEHMNAGKTASEGMASSLDEKLSQATSVYDTQIEDAIKDVERYEQEIKEATQELADMEKELAELEAKHKNSSWFRKQTKAYRREAWRIEDLRDEIEGHEVKMDDGSSFRTGKKQFIEDLQGWKQSAQSWVDYYKKQKAEELGITEEVEEKKLDAQRLTQEQMQEGIKLLEEEYRKTDHTTEAGIKRREQLRQTIDQMNQEIKESTGEWMSLAQAEELASKAGTSGFFATGQQMQQATQAIERQRDALVKTIQQKQRDGEATKKEEEELQRMEKVLKDLKFEQDNFNMSHKQMEDLLKHPKKADDLDQLKAAIKRADGELHRMKQSLGDNNDQYRKFAAEVKAAKNELKLMEGQAKATTGQLEKAWSRLKTYVGLYMGFNMAWQKFTGTIGDMKELSDRMGEVGKTTQMAAGEIARMTTNLSKLDTRTALTSLVELSAKAGQLGLKSREDVEGFTEAANKMLVALPEMGADGATQMMKVALATGEVAKIQKEMDDGLIEGSSATAVAMEKIASTIDQLRANSAAAAPAITDFVKRVGAVGAQSGITIDQVAALGSTVDALGMRVEMSATALSRMIPAIKNNAFDVAKAIGMAPEALRKMFDEAGGGMNAMLAIFQHIKDQGMNANDIEKMLGMGGMQEIMKELNQQGARAGIVFAGLSQNVDVLREHLSIAGKAYEENIAIQQEYDRMNETTAAKWERLGNQIEEMFVGPGTQSVLGDIADALRVIVDLVSGPLNTAFWATSAAVLSIKSGLTSLPEAGGKVLDYLKESAYKAGEALREAAEKGEEMSKTANGVEQAADAVSDIGDALEGAQEVGEQAGEAVGTVSGAITNMGGAARVSIFSINGLKMAWKGLDATMKANIIVAVIALLWTLGKALYDAMKATDAERDAVAKANQEADRAVEKLGGYFARLKETKDELEKATKATEEMTDSTKDATDAEIKMTKAKEDHRAAILNINKNYGQYLGFMLTEYDRAELVAAAHNKIAAAIRREMLMKAKQAAIEDTGKEYEEGLSKNWSEFSEELVSDKRLSAEQAAEAKLALKKFLPKSFTLGSDGKTLVASKELRKSLGGLYNENASLNELTAVWFARHLQQNYGLGREAIKDITGIDYYKSDYGTTKGQYAWTKSRGWSNLRGDYLDEYFEMQQKNAKKGGMYNEDINAETKNIEEQSSTLVKELKTNVQAQIALLKTGNLTTKETEDAYGELARSLEGINENVSGLTAAEQKTTEDTIKKILEQNKAVIDSKRLQKARENIQKSFDAFDTLDTGDNEKNPWGSNQPAESTDWKNMTAEQLVNRRKQMKDFVNAIQTDTDVQSVLKEDAALKKAIENGMSSDMRTVIEWYNTERLKIQDELHARHLTNTGDWMDPKKERGAKKQFRDEMDAYLHELDAYYTERKTRIEEAGTDEGLTEAEIRNRTLNNEMEWQQRRAELQKLYSRKQKDVTQEELDAIYHIIAERTGDSESFVKAQIAKTNQFVDNIEKSGEKGAAIVHRWMSQVELDTERSYLKGQQALTKQMRAIEAIIDKERPFNGITNSLQESLSTMDVLTGDMRKEYNELMKQGKDMTDFNNRQAQEEMKRTAFLLGEAENAYSTTIDNVMDDMRQKGMTAWADWLSADPKLQEALMAQLRSTYDAIQDAIKKEASQLKKQAEIMWNNILMPDGKTTLKQQTDRIVAQFGLDEGRVKRANSLIGAGQASERVADKLAIQQMKVQLAMQEHYYNLMRKQGQAHVDMLNAQAKAAKERGDEEEATRKTLDAQHAQMSLNLATSKEETELAKQREEIIARTEESQNRLYTELKSWADLLSSSMQGVMEASHAGDAEYYNERAKLDLTGNGGPGAGTYVVIDNAGTSDAKAHYEYLDERQALERQREIERENAMAEAWKKVWDDINQKLSDTITDQLNALFQNAALDVNTQAIDVNTDAITGLTGAVNNLSETITAKAAQDASYRQGGNGQTINGGNMGVDENGAPNALKIPEATEGTPGYGAPWMQPAPTGTEQPSPMAPPPVDVESYTSPWAAYAQANSDATKTVMENDKKAVKSSKQSFAAMTAAANMYGVAYRAMSNENLSTSQKVWMMIVQAAGQAMISMLTASLAADTGETASHAPAWISKTLKELGPVGGPVAVGVFTALIGGLMATAVSKISKSKSEIAQATGGSVGAGRLSTGMLTYAEGNVNEFTDPGTLTPGRQYNVDAADGRTYRARYMGKNAKTHITNGPEFHLVGEKGREAIIDAHTTRLMQMDDIGIWQSIQTLYNGGSRGLSAVRRRGRGVRAFAEGNMDEFEMPDGEAFEGTGGMNAGMSGEQAASLQASIDRQNELLEDLRRNPIHAVFDVYGKSGLVDTYDTAKKTLNRHGEKY